MIQSFTNQKEQASARLERRASFATAVTSMLVDIGVVVMLIGVLGADTAGVIQAALAVFAAAGLVNSYAVSSLKRALLLQRRGK